MAASCEESIHPGSLDVFKHDNLDLPCEQIRLIRLLDTKHNEDISTEISTWHIKNSPEYVAMSYTWGDERDLCSIAINGKDFTIRQNCRYALQQVRRQHPSDYIWIDSICINQGDVLEKSFQVSRMADVYANAKSVCVCVGPHMDQSELLKSYGVELKAISEKRRAGELTHADFKHLDRLLKDKLIKFTLEKSELMLAWEYVALTHGQSQEHVENAVSTIFAFTQRTYWQRLWIIQEIVFAGTKLVLCGDHALEWKVMQLFHNLASNIFDLSHFSTVMSDSEPNNKRLTLGSAIRHFGSFHCSDVRDHIFGILGLMDRGVEEHALAAPDYSLSPHDVLLRVISSIGGLNPDILQAFKIFNVDSESPKSQRLLQLGRANSTREFIAPHDTPAFLSWLQTWTSYCDICPIDEHNRGDLVANFVREPREDLYYGGSPEYSLYPYRDGNIPPFALPLYSGTSLAGLACVEAQKGDLLASIWSHRPDVLLVLRHFQDDLYTIVGQALSVNGFWIENSSHSSDAKMLLTLSAEKLFLLWSQDYVGDDSKTLNEYEIFDPEAHMQRLRTDVVLFPDLLRPRVRISLPETDA